MIQHTETDSCKGGEVGPFFNYELQVLRLSRPILHFYYKKIVAQTMAVVSATNLSMFFYMIIY
mgnify:FL=1